MLSIIINITTFYFSQAYRLFSYNNFFNFFNSSNQQSCVSTSSSSRPSPPWLQPTRPQRLQEATWLLAMSTAGAWVRDLPLIKPVSPRLTSLTGEKINMGSLRKFNWRMRGIDTDKVCQNDGPFPGIKDCLWREGCAPSSGGCKLFAVD